MQRSVWVTLTLLFLTLATAPAALEPRIAQQAIGLAGLARQPGNVFRGVDR